LVLKDTLNEMSLEGIIRLIRKALLFSLFIEGAGAVLLALRWSAEMPFAQAVYMGVWHAISFFNNAGFDLLGPYGGMTMYTEDLIVNLTAMGLILLGGIGFIVMVDLAEYRRRKHLSLHSKVVLSMTALLTLSGAVVLFIFEFTNEQTMGPLDGAGKVLASFFHCVSRTSGTTTLDIGSMRQASQFFLILVMFIGASPGSVGGGIKTTTFAILLGAMLSIIRGKKDVVLFRHRVPERQVFKAITLTLFAFTIVLAATMILSITERYPILEILFEVTSAFATVGMTTGLTPDLTVFGKIVIIITMFIGRLGPLTLAYALGSNAKPELYRHPEGKIMIG
jgi:trk system potassium uptake protein TrkH